jgi:uncharacterized protein (TIGR02145 family)
MKCVKGLGFLWVAVLAAFFAFSACDDSSSASEDNNETSAVESSSSTTVNKDKSSDSKTKQSSSSDEEQNTGEPMEYSSSSRKTTSKSESSSSVAVSSSGGDEDLIPCSVEGRRAQVGPEMLEYICENGFLVPYIAPSSSSLSLHAKDSITHPESIFKDNEKFSFYYDNRDGLEKKYTVYMEHTSSGDTLYVFVDNLNYGKQVLSSETEFDDNVVEKYCYNDDPWYCDNYYGALYTWSEAMALPKVCESLSQEDSRCQIKIGENGGHQGICPEGWFVMSVRNWSDAFLNDGGIPNSSLYYSGDTHTILGLIYTGHLQQFGKDTAEYEAIWESAYFWSASENTSSDKATVFFTYNSMYEQTDYDRIVSKRNAYPVRCARIVEEAE